MSERIEPGEHGAASARSRLRRLEVAAVALFTGWAATVAWIATRETSVPDVLSVERLEIVEPDGRPAFVLANSERPTTGTIDGEVLMKDQADERRMPNFIFFDGHGDEVGGMLFGNLESGEGFTATRHLSLDGYKQDQTVQLFHRQTPDGAASGLSVTDRPQHRTLQETFTELGLEIPHTRQQARAAIAEVPAEARADSLRKLFGANRVFLGSDDRGRAALILKDDEARPRIVLGVPEDGDPYLQILDEAGEPLAEFP